MVFHWIYIGFLALDGNPWASWICKGINGFLHGNMAPMSPPMLRLRRFQKKSRKNAKQVKKIEVSLSGAMKKWAYRAKSELIRLKSELIRSKRAYPVAEYTRIDIFRARRISSQLIRRTSVSGKKTSLSGRKFHEMAVGIKNSNELIRRKSELRSSWLDLSCRIAGSIDP